MFKLYKDAFKTTNDGLILTIPLALFWWLITLYIDYSKAVVDTIPEMILSVITMLFMTSAFCAGWFYMVKKSVKFSKKHFILDKDKVNESISLIKAIPIGIGRFFLHYVEVSLLFLVIALLMCILLKFVTLPFVTEINEVLVNFGISVSSPQEMREILDKLPPEQIMKLFDMIFAPSVKLVLTVIIIPAIFSFLLLLWMPEIIYTHRNPLVALFNSIKKVFIKFWKSLNLYIYITIIQMLISSLGAVSLINTLFYLGAMVVYFYFLVYVIVLIFSYYDSEFIGTKK